jgi:hypothetical protein
MANLDTNAVRFAVREVTPADAVEWLKRDDRPQRQSMRYVHAYAREMSERRWQLNGGTIIFSTTGRLLDGRKRLRACQVSGSSFPVIVVEDVREEDFQTIDALRARTAVDSLYIGGEEFPRRLSAVLNIVYRYYRYYQHPGSTESQVTPRETLFLLDLRPEIRESVQKTAGLSRVGWHSVAAAAHHLASRVDSRRADSFFDRVASNTTAEGDPADLLRKQLEASTGSGQERMLALTILAWNAEYLSIPLKTLRWRQDGDRPQRFPTVAGLPDEDGADLEQQRQPNYEVEVDPGDLEIGIETITPADAEGLLASNDNNRKIIPRVAEKYARDMQAGSWALNGQTLKVSTAGRLLDGQHRCYAAMKAGKSFQAIVVRGLPDAIFETLDSGPVRSLGEVLGTRGERNVNSLAAALQKLWLYEQDMPTYNTLRGSHAELLRVLEENPEIRESVHFTLSHLREVIPGGIAGTTHCLAARTDRERANHFMARVGDGVELRLNDPIRRFRELMLRDRANKRNPFREVEKWALMIKAVNAFFQGAEVRLLVWRPGAGEGFPRMLGRIPTPRSPAFDRDLEPLATG